MNSIDVDDSEIRDLVRRLDTAYGRAVPEVRKIVERGAVNIKKGWKQRWSGIGHAPALPRAVTYDLVNELFAVEAEIGPDKERRQGALGNLIEFGSANNAPIPGGLPALQAEEPRTLAALEKTAVDILDLGP